MADSRREQGTKRARSPSRSPSRSPPRKQKRPGRASRVHVENQEAKRLKQQEAEKQAQQEAASRGVHDVVKQHYNMVPEYGRDWRNTESKIGGLRKYNNWVKSCLINKFIGNERNLKILDIGCGKGGDLQKWDLSRKVELYVGADPADVSIRQARGRYEQMRKKNRRFIFHAEFFAKDCFGEWLGEIPIVRDVGIDPGVGPNNAQSQRWGGGGWDMVTMMFCMHYAFENEEKARGMLRNVSGALKRGGRFIGCIPNSDVLSAKVIAHHKALGRDVGDSNAAAEESDDDRPTFASDDEDDWDPEKSLDSPKPNADGGEDKAQDEAADKQDGENEPTAATEKAKIEQEDGEVEEEGFQWGNSIYSVKFPGKTPRDGTFRPPFGWKYFYHLEEAVEAPEYVVPWEAFRALAEDYNLELQYRKPFREMWEEQESDRDLALLAERMKVKEQGTGRLLVKDEELDASDFYHAFCFYKV